MRVQRELQERDRLLDEIERADTQRIALARDVARKNERVTRLRAQATALRHGSTTDSSWLEKVRHGRAMIEKLVRDIQRESAEIQFIDNRIAEYENRLVDLVDSDSELEALRDEQAALLAEWSENFRSVFSPVDLDDFRELLATIADAQEHIAELDEAIVFGEKAAFVLRELLDQVWVVWRAPNDYRLGREIDKIAGLVESAETRLSWFNRELWDVDRQFDGEPVVAQRIAFFEDIQHHADAQPAPRVDPSPIETLNQQVRDKIYLLRDELSRTQALLTTLETRRVNMVKELWSTDVFRL